MDLAPDSPRIEERSDPHRRVGDVLNQYIGGLRQSLGYNGCRTLSDLQARGTFKRITPAGSHESHPHDITMTKDAPNYKATKL